MSDQTGGIEPPIKTVGYPLWRIFVSLVGNSARWPLRLVTGRCLPWDLEVFRQCRVTVSACLLSAVGVTAVAGFAYAFVLEGRAEVGVAVRGALLSYYGSFLLSNMVPVSIANMVVNYGALSMCMDMTKAVREGEWDALSMRRVDPLDAVFFPRALAMVLIAPALSIFGIVAVAAGSFFAALVARGSRESFQEFCISLLRTTEVSDLLMVPAKTAAIALVTSCIAAQCGLPAERQSESLGRVATRVMTWSVGSIMVINAGVSMLVDLLKRHG